MQPKSLENKEEKIIRERTKIFFECIKIRRCRECQIPYDIRLKKTNKEDGEGAGKLNDLQKYVLIPVALTLKQQCDINGGGRCLKRDQRTA